jgi:hypothetical protein
MSVVVHACNPSYSGGRGRRIISSRIAWTKVATSYLNTKHTKIRQINKRAGVTAEASEHMPNICEALCSTPSAPKKSVCWWHASLWCDFPLSQMCHIWHLQNRGLCCSMPVSFLLCFYVFLSCFLSLLAFPFSPTPTILYIECLHFKVFVVSLDFYDPLYLILKTWKVVNISLKINWIKLLYTSLTLNWFCFFLGQQLSMKSFPICSVKD